MIEAKHPTESFHTSNFAVVRILAAIRLDQSVVEPLVVPLGVVMSGELPRRFPKRSFSEEDHPIEAFVLDRPDETLGAGVQVGRTVR